MTNDRVLYRVTFVGMADEYDFGSLAAVAAFESKYQTRRLAVVELPFDEEMAA